MKATCINHPANESMIVIRKWQLEFCENDTAAAALLSFFEYWHNIKTESSGRNHHLNRVAEMHGDEPVHDTSLFQWHTHKELSEAIMGIATSPDRIRRSLNLLVRKGVITIHLNPNSRYKFDRTKYFVFCPDVVNRWLDENRKRLSDASAKNGNGVSEDRSAENGRLSAENGNLSAENGNLSAENSRQLLYTETTSKITATTAAEMVRPPAAAVFSEDDFKNLIESIPVKPPGSRIMWFKEKIISHGFKYIHEKVSYANATFKDRRKYWNYLGQIVDNNWGYGFLDEQCTAAEDARIQSAIAEKKHSEVSRQDEEAKQKQQAYELNLSELHSRFKSLPDSDQHSFVTMFGQTLIPSFQSRLSRKGLTSFFLPAFLDFFEKQTSVKEVLKIK